MYFAPFLLFEAIWAKKKGTYNIFGLEEKPLLTRNLKMILREI